MALTKGERTKITIIEKVAPIFNQMGYVGTSMSDITKATNLTKGAIYGNFEDKAELALAAFNYNVRFVIRKIQIITDEIESPTAKLFAITNFYREYYMTQQIVGGCPILNVGVDAQGNNSALLEKVKVVAAKLQVAIANIIEEGKNKGEIRPDVDHLKYGKMLFSMIEGAMFTSTLLKDGSHLSEMMNFFDGIITKELLV